jgi:dihydroorotate dehydrogenase electron transfer subunit
MLRPHGVFEPLLRRAFAFYRQPDPNRLSFLYQVLGRGTQALAAMQSGSMVQALLPLGNSWEASGESFASRPARAVVIAGGIGSASVFMLCETLKRRRIDTRIFFGAASRAAAVGCGLRDFEKLELPLVLTTDDGSLGIRGLVTEPLDRFLDEERNQSATIYACGPWAMMRRVAEIASTRDAPCTVSLEAPMGCGFGVCVGCVVAVKAEGPAGYHSYKRVCVDGSIFPASAINWEVNAMSH